MSWLSALRGVRRGRKGGFKRQTQLPFSYVAPAALLKHTRHACRASLVQALSAAMHVGAARFSCSTSAAAAAPAPEKVEEGRVKTDLEFRLGMSQ